MAKYSKITGPFEACQFPGFEVSIKGTETMLRFEDWFKEHAIPAMGFKGDTSARYVDNSLVIWDGQFVLKPGDWIIVGLDGMGINCLTDEDFKKEMQVWQF